MFIPCTGAGCWCSPNRPAARAVVHHTIVENNAALHKPILHAAKDDATTDWPSDIGIACNQEVQELSADATINKCSQPSSIAQLDLSQHHHSNMYGMFSGLLGEAYQGC